MLIEQAIFTSARATRGSGYHLVAKSPGISQEEACELAVWGPSHGSLCDEREEASSVNFHHLSSGRYCVSKSVAAGAEYSGRGGARIYTQSLIVSPEVFARFANNAFAVLRAAWAKGLLNAVDPLPSALEPFKLAGRTAKVDEGLLAQLAEQCGPESIARLVAAAITSGRKALVGAANNDTLFAGLLNCLPVECRPEVTFTTGLRFSPRRRFKLVALEHDSNQKRRTTRQQDVTVVDLAAGDPEADPPHGWAAYVAELVAADRLTVLANQLQVERPGLELEHLAELGEKLLREFRRSPVAVGEMKRKHSPSLPTPRLQFGSRPARRGESTIHDAPAPAFTTAGAERRAKLSAAKLSELGAVSDPQAVDLIEQLDDAVYEAINGEPCALGIVRDLWVRLTTLLPSDTVASLREQYLRYALTLWEACADDGVRQPQRAAGALDVVSVLFDDE